MASGDVVGYVHAITFPASNPCTPDVRVGGATPGELYSVYDFDAATNEYLDVICRLINYGGGGLTIPLTYMMSTATSGNIIWGAAIRRRDTADDIDASHTYDFNDAAANAVPGTSGYQKSVDITFTDGTDMDSVADGEEFILRIRRNAASGSDTASGDAELVGFAITET